ATTPLILVVIPILGLFTILLIDPSSSGVQTLFQLATCALVLMPMISPVFTMFFVKSYRQTLFDMLGRALSQMSIAGPTSSHSSTYISHHATNSVQRF
ncbi:hypothetical protein AAVH_42211, partial [Aphelenchoides avenae]